MITKLFPILSTPDMGRALAFYRDLLGARVGYEFEAPDGTPAYVGLEFGESHLGVGVRPAVADGSPLRPISLWVTPPTAMPSSNGSARPA